MARITCRSAIYKGSGTTAQGASGSAVFRIDGSGAQYSLCEGPAGLKFALTGRGTWSVNISDSTSEVSVGQISNVIISLQATSGPPCSMDFAAYSSATGYIDATPPAATIVTNFSNNSSLFYTGTLGNNSFAAWNVKTGSTTGYCAASSLFALADKFSLSTDSRLQADVTANNPVSIR